MPHELLRLVVALPVAGLVLGLVWLDTFRARRLVVARKPAAIAVVTPPAAVATAQTLETKPMNIGQRISALGVSVAALLAAGPAAIEAKAKAAITADEAAIQKRIDDAVAGALGNVEAVITGLETQVADLATMLGIEPPAAEDAEAEAKTATGDAETA